MSLAQYAAVRMAIAAALKTISGLSVHKEEPDTVPQWPFAILGNGTIEYGTDMGGGQNTSFKLFLAVREADSEHGFEMLDDFLAASGAKSVPATLEAASIGNGFLLVTRAENIGHVRYREVTWIGAEFIIQVQSGG